MEVGVEAAADRRGVAVAGGCNSFCSSLAAVWIVLRSDGAGLCDGSDAAKNYLFRYRI